MDKISTEDFIKQVNQHSDDAMELQEKQSEKQSHTDEFGTMLKTLDSNSASIVKAIKQKSTDVKVTNLPDIPKPDKVVFPKDFSVNNLQDYNDKLDAVISAVKAIKVNFEPNIEVKASDVQVQSDFTSLEAKLDEVVKSFKNIKSELKPNITVKPADVSVSTDFATLENQLKDVVRAVKSIKINIPERDDKKVLDKLTTVAKAINSLSFPIPNYVLPYSDTQGAATQVKLTEAGAIPVDIQDTSVTITGDVNIDTSALATENTLEKLLPYQGTATDTTLTLTDASTAYACPASPPTNQYQLFIYNASDTDIYCRLTTGTTGGFIIPAGRTFVKEMGADNSLYLYCGSAGKIVNVSYEEA